jgi:hypothetical protein
MQNFPLKANRRSPQPDFQTDDQIFLEAGMPVDAQMFNYGDNVSVHSPVDSLSSGYGSGELLHPAPDSQEHRLSLGFVPHNSLQQEEDADEEPLYVNAKQYHRILKRRAARARLEELNQLIRQRKVSMARSTRSHSQVTKS